MWRSSGLENGYFRAHICGMKNLSIVVYALAGAGVVALSIAHLAHTVLGVPSAAIRNDALGTAACLTAFIGAGLLARKRSK